MKSFKEYTRRASEAAEIMERSDGNTTGQENEPKDTNAQSAQATSTEELTRKIAMAYHGTSNANMLRAILEEAEKSKRAGTLSNEEIETFYQSFAPMLNGFQKKQLRAVVERLKEIE